MHLLKLRNAENDSGRAEEAAKQFTRLLFSGRIDEAKQITAQNFSWFGETNLDWSAEGIREFVTSEKTTTSNIRLIESSMVQVFEEPQRLKVFGKLDADDRVLLIDLTRNEKTSTATIVVDTQKQKVVRILDATPFKNALQLLVDEADPHA